MSNLAGSKLKDKYKDLLHTSNNNTGISTSLKNIKCGDGDSTSLSLSNKSLAVQPASDNTSVLDVQNTSGQSLLEVDSNNSLVKSGIGAHIVNTQDKQFGVFDMQGVAGYHLPIISNPMMYSTSGAVWTGGANGSTWGSNGEDPATSLTLATEAEQLIPALWILHSNITIQEVNYVLCTENATTCNIHVMSYDVVAGSGSTAGDLSNGAVASHNTSSITTGVDRVSTGTLTNLVTDINSDKAIVVFVEVATAYDFTAQVNIKYNLR